MSVAKQNSASAMIAEYKFPGGIKLQGHKAISTQGLIKKQARIPKVLTIPLRQHIGQEVVALVEIGDTVKKGQLLARAKSTFSAAVHASTSGTISAIEDRPVPHPSGMQDLCIEITSDGNDTSIESRGYSNDWPSASPQELLEKLNDSGIVGLGGATFPTAVKVQSGFEQKVSTLIINGAECEPWISCDQALMQEQSLQILEGIAIVMHITNTSNCLIGIEDNKADAITAMTAACESFDQDIKVVTSPTLYPTGGERQLIKVLTNKSVPKSGLPIDIGMLVLNVATAWALANFIKNGEPLTSRVVTVTGDGIVSPCNISARIGTPMNTLIEQAGGYTATVKQLSMGGPMMGFALDHDEYPIVKASNCLLAQTPQTISIKPSAMPCIRCGACSESCPMELLPQQLYWYSRAKNLDGLERFSIQSCITCGACDYVCPSHIPLSHYFRFAKSEIKNAASEQKKADNARLRHEARQDRLERIKKEKAEKLAAKKAALAEKKKNAEANDSKDSKQSAIADALARSKKRKAQLKKDSSNDTAEVPDTPPERSASQDKDTEEN